MDINKLHNEDNRITMSRMACDCIDTIITDPPYGLQFMGKKWDYEIPSAETFAEMYRVAKPGATLLCFGGTRTWHRIAVNIEDAGWEIRDTLMWLYGSGFPKAADLSKMFDKKNGVERKVIGKGASQPAKGGHFGGLTGDNIQFAENGERFNPDITQATSPDAITWNGWKSHGLKPAYEPIIMAIKPNDGTYIENALKHGVSGLNIDGGRIPIASDENNPSGSGNMYLKNNAFNPVKTTKRKERKSETWKNGSGFKNENNYLAETDPKGRFPSNVLLDEQAAKILDEQTGTLTSGMMKKGTKRQMSSNPGVNCYSWYNPDEVESDTYGDSGGASRFFYIAKTSNFERNYGCAETTSKGKNHHPTVKPLRLMMYLCELTKTPTGGIVYDPFSGSGTTLIAAKLTGRDFIGSEIEKDSCKIAEARLKHHHEQIKLF